MHFWVSKKWVWREITMVFEVHTRKTLYKLIVLKPNTPRAQIRYKNNGLRDQRPPHRSGKHILNQLSSKCGPAGGGRHKLRKTKRLSDMSAGRSRRFFPQEATPPNAAGSDDGSSQTPSNEWIVNGFCVDGGLILNGFWIDFEWSWIDFELVLNGF